MEVVYEYHKTSGWRYYNNEKTSSLRLLYIRGASDWLGCSDQMHKLSKRSDYQQNQIRAVNKACKPTEDIITEKAYKL